MYSWPVPSSDTSCKYENSEFYNFHYTQDCYYIGKKKTYGSSMSGRIREQVIRRLLDRQGVKQSLDAVSSAETHVHELAQVVLIHISLGIVATFSAGSASARHSRSATGTGSTSGLRGFLLLLTLFYDLLTSQNVPQNRKYGLCHASSVILQRLLAPHHHDGLEGPLVNIGKVLDGIERFVDFVHPAALGRHDVWRVQNSFRIDHLLQKHEPNVQELSRSVGQVGMFQALRHGELSAPGQGPLERREESVLSSQLDKLLQHQVVRIALLVEQHRGRESNRADEEGKPEFGNG